MGRPFLRSIPHASRSLLNIRYRFVIVASIFALFQQQQHLYFSHRISLAAKYSPTTFDCDPETLHARIKRPDDEDTHFQQDIIANRASWKVLGKGWEGTVYVYKDSAIKMFLPRSPLRNCASGQTNERWPTEIPASLFFGGTTLDMKIETNQSQSGTYRPLDGFRQVNGFFKTSIIPFDPPQWHLVTPLLRDGNLDSLAKKLSKHHPGSTLRERDSTFRPAFNRLLATLETLHSSGYCHDDIKPGNIFVRDSQYWVLGDLGNVRNILHPYHSSRLWKSNSQLADCRANDAMRLLKSYLKFLRSSMDSDAFNTELYEGQEPLVKLFWWALTDARTMSAIELQRRSLIQDPESSGKNITEEASFAPVLSQHPWSLIPRQTALRYAADSVLMTRMSETIARWWAMVWLFGVPVPEVCGFANDDSQLSQYLS
ncbi:hypothetical protein T440DRAFT_465124 [Plenodomus tracheiphilus IPT5]|uniref:Protein kinase domain-containing protein n=1 Tax=Plenodomus tracheiphilus IPT5 TaxID=1408161 RepID=A0A6A7BJ41_9PLEO|nr:hypothetical protein T440DRAFT_465124 [Plenodomus tracheiphilus IPT5]